MYLRCVGIWAKQEAVPICSVAGGTLQKERDDVPRAALRSQRDDALTFHQYVSVSVRFQAPFLMGWDLYVLATAGPAAIDDG